LLLLAALALTAILLAPGRSPQAGSVPDDVHENMDHAGHDMSEEAMQRAVDEWFATHPVVGANQATGAPVVTFRVFSSKFDVDGNLSTTPIDTVVIGVGETVEWQRLIGAHTVTDGWDSSAPLNGTMFDVPLDSANPVFQFTYNLAGTFPFYCRTHEDFTMVGVVEVVGAVPTRRTTWGELKANSR
jgi:plastocyanin